MSRLAAPARLFVLAVLLAAWAWRLGGLDAQSLWRDEVDSLRFATQPLAQVLRNFTRPGENGPLYFLLLRPWLQSVGTSEYALRFPSALTGLLALPLTLAWGQRLFGRAAGLLALVLLAANPYHVWYSQEAKMYALLVSLVLLTLWVFAEAMDRGGWRRWLAWLLLTTACIYIHVLAALIVPLQIVWLALRRQWRRRWPGFAAALAFLVLPYVPLVWWQWALLTDSSFRTGHPFVSLPDMLTSVFAAQFQGIPALPSSWLLGLPIFLILAALFLPAQARSSLSSARLLVLAWWLLPILAVFAISLATPIFTDRYLIWTLPAFGLLLAMGGRLVWDQRPWLAALVLLAILMVQVWAGWQQMSRPIKSDFRAAAAYVAPRRQAGDLTLFLIPYIRHTYQYYDPAAGTSDADAYAWAEAPYANREPDASLAPERLQALVQGYHGVWLVESEAEFYDRQGLIRDWLEARGRLVDSVLFSRVQVTYFALDP